MVTWAEAATVGLLAAQLIVITVAAVVAYRQVRESRRLRIAQTRPFVVLDAVVNGSIIELVLSNSGRTLARNVVVTVDPPFRSSNADLAERLRDLRMFSPKGIPSLAPGRELRTVLDTTVRFFEKNLPTVYEVLISYDNPYGRRRFEDRISVDLGVHRGLLVRRDATLSDIDGKLKEALGVIKRWKAPVGQGLLCVSPLDIQNRLRAIEEDEPENGVGHPSAE